MKCTWTHNVVKLCFTKIIEMGIHLANQILVDVETMGCDESSLVGGASPWS